MESNSIVGALDIMRGFLAGCIVTNLTFNKVPYQISRMLAEAAALVPIPTKLLPSALPTKKKKKVSPSVASLYSAKSASKECRRKRQVLSSWSGIGVDPMAALIILHRPQITAPCRIW